MGDVTSLNITTLEAGVRVGDTFAYNCMPPMAKCTFDIRISPHVKPREIGDMINDWCRECSASPEEGYEVGSMTPTRGTEFSVTRCRPWGTRLCIRSSRPPAATDSRFLRQLDTKIMMLENDEYLVEDVFIEGIEVYVGLIAFVVFHPCHCRA